MSKFGKVFIAAIVTIGAISCSASSLAKQSLKVEGQDVKPWDISS